jgi:galacturan 1,4-alpha-galacturonidase
MRLSSTLPLAVGWLTAVVHAAVPLPPGVPGNVLEFRDKHRYLTPRHDCRKTITIRSSEDEEDDVSQEFFDGIMEANNGGTLYLPKGETFVIGKVLDLTGLNNIHVHLDGEIRVSSYHLLEKKHGADPVTVHE